ncbi:hypothetical protein, partial [Dokdonella sp.]|uniref:hypothetical protein n=1 Tax=Dokdonella sp. TaxID=2291710 RepID=UPI003C5B873F
AILYGITSGALASAHLQFDSLSVHASDAAAIPSDLEFLQEPTTAVENQTVAPAVKIGVLNILDQPVPDVTSVTLEIAAGSGPPGAGLLGNNAITVGGIATFHTLKFDTLGTYRLVARSLDAVKLGNVDVVVEQGDALFVDGFDSIDET